jgi:hypothetical protein
MVYVKTDKKWMELRTKFYMEKSWDKNFIESQDGRTRKEWARDKAFDDWINRDEPFIKAWARRNLGKVV